MMIFQLHLGPLQASCLLSSIEYSNYSSTNSCHRWVKYKKHYSSQRANVLLLLLGSFLIGIQAQAAATAKTQEPAILEFKTGVIEKGATPSDLKSVALFSKSSDNFAVSTTQRFYTTFQIVAKGTETKLKPHQVFLLLEHVETSSDIVFVADAQQDGSYVVDVDLNKVGGDFDGLSGKYKARLIVGDASFKNSIDWHFADVAITVPAAPVVVEKKSEKIILDPLPEIQHKFREPEKRPPGVVSDAFTLLCLSPLVILLGLWLRIGINISNIPVSLWTLLFHGGLAGIFGLYFVFWLRLNMFDTLKYLALIGSVTFFAGNRLLRVIASRRKEKTN